MSSNGNGNEMLSFVNQESQGNIHSLECRGDGIMVNNNPSTSFPSDHGSQYVFNENDHLSVNWENRCLSRISEKFFLMQDMALKK